MKASIVMYHYVRDAERSRFPAIKALTVEGFRQQVGYLKKHHNIIGGPELTAAIVEGAPLPPRAALLTFDDGYADHFTTVFPLLEEERIPGCFFPPAACVLEDKVLDVNKIHHILASGPTPTELIESLWATVRDHAPMGALLSPQEYWAKFGVSTRYDCAEVSFLKLMLQRELPQPLRGVVASAMFAKHVSVDEAGFARELYMDMDQVRCLARHGMMIGNGGYSHEWMDALGDAEQRSEVQRSLEFLRMVYPNVSDWVMCYPYGAYDHRLLEIIADAGCVAGVTTRVAIARLGQDHPLELPRLDTNDMPFDAAAPPNSWTLAA